MASSATLVSQIRKWRLREVKKFAQSVTAGKWSPKSGTVPVFLVLQSEIVLGGVSLLETAQDPACLMVYHCRTQSKISERKRHMGLSLGETSIRLPRVLSQWSHRDTLNSLNSKTWQFVLIVACREPGSPWRLFSGVGVGVASRTGALCPAHTQIRGSRKGKHAFSIKHTVPTDSLGTVSPALISAGNGEDPPEVHVLAVTSQGQPCQRAFLRRAGSGPPC